MSVARAGLQNLRVQWKLWVVSSPLSFYELLLMYRRWLIFGASGLPARFLGIIDAGSRLAPGP